MIFLSQIFDRKTAKFCNYFILRTNYDHTRFDKHDHHFFSRRVSSSFPFFLNHRHTLKKENVQEHMRKRVVSRKNFERMPVLFRARHRLESAAFLPPDGNRVRDIPYFCLVRKCTGGNEFSTRSWTLMHVWTSRWWTLSPAWIGEIHEGR